MPQVTTASVQKAILDAANRGLMRLNLLLTMTGTGMSPVVKTGLESARTALQSEVDFVQSEVFATMPVDAALGYIGVKFSLYASASKEVEAILKADLLEAIGARPQ